MMGDWMEMAEVVGRKLVENGQEKILQRIFDGVNSNFVLDSFDFKESHHHQLLHLVWRRFPRNGCPTGVQKTTTSDSTQTDETEDRSSVGLLNNLKPLTAGNSIALDKDSNFATDNFATDSFKTPAKRQSSKPRTLETTKYQTGTSNRFDCLKKDTPPVDDTLVESGRQSPSSPQIFFGNNRPNLIATETLHSSSEHSSESLKSEIEHKSKPEKKKKIEKKLPNTPTPLGPNGKDPGPLLPSALGSSFPSCTLQYKIGTVKSCSRERAPASWGPKYANHYTGFVITGDHGNVMFRSNHSVAPGSRITYKLETIKYGNLRGEKRAFDVSPYQDAFSPGRLSHSDFEF